jgi:hypothetical protein
MNSGVVRRISSYQEYLSRSNYVASGAGVAPCIVHINRPGPTPKW